MRRRHASAAANASKPYRFLLKELEEAGTEQPVPSSAAELPPGAEPTGALVVTAPGAGLSGFSLVGDPVGEGAVEGMGVEGCGLLEAVGEVVDGTLGALMPPGCVGVDDGTDDGTDGDELPVGSGTGVGSTGAVPSSVTVSSAAPASLTSAVASSVVASSLSDAPSVVATSPTRRMSAHWK